MAFQPQAPDVEAARMKQIAALSLVGGLNVDQISKEMSLSVSTVRRVMQKEAFKDLLKEYGDKAVEDARNDLRARTSKLAGKVWQTLEKLLDSDSGKDNAEGIRSYFRLIGVDQKDQDTGVGNLTINLPGQPQGKVVEVPSEVTDADPVQK